MNEIKHEIKEINKNNNNTEYNISVSIPMSLGYVNDISFCVYKDNFIKTVDLKHTNNLNGISYFNGNTSLDKSNLYHYFIKYKINNITHYLKDDSFKISSLYNTPSWSQGGVIYHIFVDRFNKGRKEELTPMKNRVIHRDVNEEMVIGPDSNGIWNNDFYGGDLRGIIEKLDYIKSLGTTIIYLSPIMLSQSNHRYDTSDYEMIDPYVGNNEDLKELCDKAHSKGMHVILDAVFNHTGNDSKYFNEYGNFDTIGAFQSDKSIYFPFYRKHYINGEYKFDYWWGMKNLPVCDGNSKEWQNYIYGENGVIDKWMSMGIDGLRLDVADELSDEFIKGIHDRVIKNKSDGFILGEVWKNPMRMNRNYMEYMHSVMNYPLIDALIRYYKYNDKDKLIRIINEIRHEYPRDTINSLMNFTSTHDISRIIDILSTNEFGINNEWVWDPNNRNHDYQKNYKISNSEYEKGKKIYKSYLLSLGFLPGNLSIFYGDELGVEGLGNLKNRAPIKWDQIDEEILDYIIKMNTVRNKEELLKNSDINLIDVNNNYLMYERVNDINNYLVAVNKTDSKCNLVLPSEYYDSMELFKLNNSDKKQLDSFGGLVLKKK